MQLRDKTILITGGTSGIGLELVYQLLDRGNEVIVLARSKNKMDQIEKHVGSIHPYPCDLSQRHQVEQVLDEVISNHPDVSVLINNAGVQFTPTFISDDFDYNSIGYEITTNLTSALWLTSLLLSRVFLRKQRGVIVNISSGLAFSPKTQSAVYCATKAALHSISQSLRYQLAATPVDVVEAILPLVDTPMTHGRGDNKMPAHQVAMEIVEGIEAGRSEIYIGKARMLPLMMRVAPGLMKNILRRY